MNKEISFKAKLKKMEIGIYFLLLLLIAGFLIILGVLYFTNRIDMKAYGMELFIRVKSDTNDGRKQRIKNKLGGLFFIGLGLFVLACPILFSYSS